MIGIKDIPMLIGLASTAVGGGVYIHDLRMDVSELSKSFQQHQVDQSLGSVSDRLFDVQQRIKEICQTRVRFGYRRVHVLLRREGHPDLAEEYTLRLIELDGADEENQFLHLMVLNDLGERERTLDYARTLREEARLREDMADAEFYASLIKQIKGRGRFTPYHE
jgi:hypothetical protein